MELKGTLTIFISALISTNVFAEDLNAIFKKVTELQQAGKYPQAIEELNWAKKELEKQNMEKVKTLFPEEVAGYKGQPAKTDAALGITSIQRNYTGAGGQINVSLTNTGTGAGSLGGGLAAIGQMAAMMGGMGGMGQDTFRIEGHTATLTLDEQSKSGDLTVILGSGPILKFEMTSGADGQKLRSVAEAFGISKIDNYFKGQG